MRSQLKNYFTFTRKERIAVLVLLLLILVMVLVPYYLPEKPVDIALIQSLSPGPSHAGQAETNVRRSPTKSGATLNEPTTFVSFPFDPNTIDESGWRKLGIREKTIGTIQKFLERGGKFRKPADIRKIYGLSQKEADRLEGFVTISEPSRPPVSENFQRDHVTPFSKKEYPARTGKIIEINEADSADFESLPGIGYKLAARIIQFRNRLGGFHSITQISETYGLQDSTFLKIRRYLICDTGKIQRIFINTSSIDDLKLHPYIRWQLARLIVEYRNQHGIFKRPEDLLEIEGINSETLNKLKPYLSW